MIIVDSVFGMCHLRNGIITIGVIGVVCSIILIYTSIDCIVHQPYYKGVFNPVLLLIMSIYTLLLYLYLVYVGLMRYEIHYIMCLVLNAIYIIEVFIQSCIEVVLRESRGYTNAIPIFVLSLIYVAFHIYLWIVSYSYYKDMNGFDNRPVEILTV